MENQQVTTFAAPSPSLLGVPIVSTFAQLFSAPCIEIPSFQRKYCWTLDQWQGIWQCVKNNTFHRVGRLVFYPDSSAESKKRICVDGQQRITTMLLLLCALRNSTQVTPEQAQVINQILFTQVPEPFPTSIDQVQYSRYVPSQSDQDAYYSVLIRKVTDTTSCLVQAKLYFDNKIATSNLPIPLLFNRIMNNINFIDFTLQQGSNTGEGSFEAISSCTWINSKLLFNRWPGIHLSSVDLIRNVYVAKGKGALWSKLEQAYPQPKNCDKLLAIFMQLLHVSKIDNPNTVYMEFINAQQKDASLFERLVDQSLQLCQSEPLGTVS